MSFKYKSTQDVLYVQLNNLPLNVSEGYGIVNGGGKIKHSDGSMTLYYCVDIEYITNPDMQITANHSLLFSEVPCDVNGKILLQAFWFSPVNNHKSSEKVNVMLHCLSEPTHRLNVGTGNVIDNMRDNNYMADVILSYQICDKH